MKKNLKSLVYCNFKGALEQKEILHLKGKKKREQESTLWQVEKYIFKMFSLEILPFPNVPARRLASDKPVSRKCGFSCASFLHCLGDPYLCSPVPQTLPLDLC